MIYITDEALTVLKFFKKHKNCWFNTTAVSHELNIPKSMVKEILTILASNGLLEHDEKYFYRSKENEQKMISAEEVRKYQKEQKAKIDTISCMTAIEEIIKENMTDLSCNKVIYEFKKSDLYSVTYKKLKKILEDAGYKVEPIIPSHYYEWGAISITWGE